MSWFDDLMKDPRALNNVGSSIEAGGQITGALSHMEFGQQAADAAVFQAEQLRQNAGQAQAASQRQAFDIDRQSQYIASTALAHAAASGGGASDPTVVNLIARNAGESAYRKAVALYQGEDKARLENLQADAKIYEGENVKANSNKVGVSQLFASGTTLMKSQARDKSLLQRFGGDGPDQSQTFGG